MKLLVGIILIFQLSLIFAHSREFAWGETGAYSRLALQ
jgi:hypothetical protein